jgi:hypothetical protein
MINWRAVVVTVLLNAALINAAAIGFATAKSSPAVETTPETQMNFACDTDVATNPS